MIVTRCPQCSTTFRVTPEQLRVRDGRVRCGHCFASFDALAEVVGDVQAQDAPAVEPVEAIGPEAAPTNPAEPEPAPEPSAEPMPQAEAEAEAEQETEPEPEVLPEPEPAPESLPEPEQEPAPESLPEPLAESLPEPPAEVATVSALHEDAPKAPRRWPWLLAAIPAALALFAQAAVHFRTELAVRLPGSRPALEAACEQLGCEVALPARIDLLEIEHSDLVPDEKAAGRLKLAATLRNRAPHAQAWPHLELTLTDTADRALARRVLAPADYLPEAGLATGGFPARRDQQVQFDLQTTDVAAVGYRLYLFYP